MRDQNGGPFRIETLPMPEPVYFDGQRLPASYANFYVANGIVLVPTFNDANDRVALNKLAELFPDRRVIGIASTDLVLGLGTLHCMTQQQPPACLNIVAVIPVLIWVYLLLFGRGGFWRVSKQLAPDLGSASANVRVIAVIPARNEAAVIAEAVSSLLQQDFPTPLHVVVVDDNSTDGTAQIARAAAEQTGKAAQFTVVAGRAAETGLDRQTLGSGARRCSRRNART